MSRKQPPYAVGLGIGLLAFGFALIVGLIQVFPQCSFSLSGLGNCFSPLGLIGSYLNLGLGIITALVGLWLIVRRRVHR